MQLELNWIANTGLAYSVIAADCNAHAYIDCDLAAPDQTIVLGQSNNQQY